ncbi:MAG: hypothetical protein QOH76_3933 [Thermoleophilaceae bacterium]|nr:hypothetical protein [Thermoleophilaceae bacterium]
MARSLRPLLTFCALALLAPAAAQAGIQAPVMLDGSPLNVWTDGNGSVQASVDGYTRGEWYPPSTFVDGNEVPNPNANAGFGLVVDPAGQDAAFGRFISGSLPAPASGPSLTPGNPATITTVWNLTDNSSLPLVQVTQILSYTNGSRRFDATYNVKNVSDGTLTLRANMAGDMAIRGSDRGIGFLNGTPPNRFVGGLNQEVGAAGGFVEVPSSPWSHYEVAYYGDVQNHARFGFLSDMLATTEVDNGAGIQWPDASVPSNGIATFKVGQKFIETLGLTPPVASKLTGQEHVLTVVAGDLNGNQVNKQTIHYTVTGSNQLSGKVNTGADGKATFSYVGGNPGTDLVTAFIDKNVNGTRDPDEPQAVATVSWQGPQPPILGFTAGARPVKGTVKIKLPPGTSLGKAKALGLTGAAKGFIKLTGARSIPVGSFLDTTRGTVNLLAAGGRNIGNTKFFGGNFNGSQFKLTQRKKNPLTEVSMTGGGLASCKTKVPKGGSAARKRKRRLFGNARGRFRTRGRHSSATVRGTKWSMTDTCAGTLTVVTKGSVTVRDFTLRKTRVVKSGRRYFARAPKRK